MERQGTELVSLTDWIHQIIIRRHIVWRTDGVTEESVSKRDSLALEYEAQGLLAAA